MDSIGKSFTLLVIVILSCTIASVNLATANPAPLFGWPTEPITTPPTIDIYSPAQNEIFHTSQALLNFTVTKPDSWFASPSSNAAGDVFGKVVSIYYTVDDGLPQSIAVHDLDAPFPFKENVTNPLVFLLTLNLTSGIHTIKVNVEAESYYLAGGNLSPTAVPLQASSDSINFTVAFPQPLIVAPMSTVYNKNSVPLRFTIGDLSASWIGYSLDGKANVTVTGNTTITGLSNGEHCLTVYTNDTLGNSFASETVDFSIADPFTVNTIIEVSAAVVIVIAISMIVYFKRRMHKPIDKKG